MLWAMSDKLIALVLSCLPNTTYDFPTLYSCFVIIGESADDQSGWSVSSAGDVNGDGLDDLIVGAKNVKVGKEYSAGKSYVVFGKQDNTNTIDLSDIASTTKITP
jgi:hypothetical protein